LWTAISKIVPYHGNFAWVSPVWVGFADAYVRLLASGAIDDLRFF